jgi:hypothetical protein
VQPVLAQRLAVQVFPVRVDVVVGRIVQRIGVLAVAVVDLRLAGHKGVDGRLLRAQHDVVNLPLPRGEVAVHRHGPRNVGGVHRVLAGRIHQQNVAVLQVREFSE